MIFKAMAAALGHLPVLATALVPLLSLTAQFNQSLTNALLSFIKIELFLIERRH